MQPGHIALNVSDLERAVRFYSGVFGYERLGGSDDHAFLGKDGRAVITLWTAGEDPLHHVAFEVPTAQDAAAAEARVVELGGRMHHAGVVPHREGATSGGIFFTDPDGIRLEIYAPDGVSGEAPHGEAPTCGFF
jgi:catechol 2,3-dioxygenase-like lactoylglutathione lyase family enzyme